MIDFAKARGVIIEQSANTLHKKKIKFNIVDDTIANYEWRPCPTIKGYEACREGLIRNAKNKRIWTSTHNGYVYVKSRNFHLDSCAHRTIMETFNPIDNSKDYIVDHINGIRTDNRLENLRWTSAKGNNMYKLENWNQISPIFNELSNLVGYEKMISILEEQIAIYKK